jgi:hypothetical protein
MQRVNKCGVDVSTAALHVCRIPLATHHTRQHTCVHQGRGPYGAVRAQAGTDHLLVLIVQLVHSAGRVLAAAAAHGEVEAADAAGQAHLQLAQGLKADHKRGRVAGRAAAAEPARVQGVLGAQHPASKRRAVGPIDGQLLLLQLLQRGRRPRPPPLTAAALLPPPLRRRPLAPR